MATMTKAERKRRHDLSRARHPETDIAYRKRPEVKQRQSELQKEYRERPEVKRKEAKRHHEYYLANKAKVLARSAKWAQDNLERMREINRRARLSKVRRSDG